MEKEVHAAFEAVRARHHDARAAAAGAEEIDWADRQRSRDAFLVIENQRRKLAERVHRGEGHRADRYRDLVLVTKLVALEYEHLSGRREAPDQVPPEASSQPDAPAEWAQPWGDKAMFELRASFANYARRRDQIGRRLSEDARERAGMEAEAELDRICSASQFPKPADPLDEVATTPRKPKRRGGRARDGRSRPRLQSVPEAGEAEVVPLPRPAGPRPEAAAARRPRATLRRPSVRRLQVPSVARRRPVLIGATAAGSALLLIGAFSALRGSGSESSDDGFVSATVNASERPLSPVGAGEFERVRKPKPEPTAKPAPAPRRERRESPSPQPREKMATDFSDKAAEPPAPIRNAAPPPEPKPNPKPPKSTPPSKPKPPKPEPVAGPSPAPAPLPSPAPAPAPPPPPRLG